MDRIQESTIIAHMISRGIICQKPKFLDLFHMPMTEKSQDTLQIGGNDQITSRGGSQARAERLKMCDGKKQNEESFLCLTMDSNGPGW